MIINIVQFYYCKLLESYTLDKESGVYQFMYSVLSRFFKVFDPEIKVKIGNNSLYINLSHQLPIYYYKYPNYDRALPRIGREIKKIDNRLFFVDIGANIGDTVSLITDAVQGDFLCIEGDQKSLSILEKNIKQLPKENNVQIEKCFCGDNVEDMLSTTREGGTTKIVVDVCNNTSVSEQNIKIKYLDKIIEEHHSFRNSNLLKIDTDGFEINVLGSGKSFIKEAKPLLYFEFIPELYIQNNQNPNTIWKLLREYGYKEALFYDNFGKAIEIINIHNQDKIDELVSKIDNVNLHYYDVLTYHNEEFKYSEILKNELSLFI